MPIRVLIADDHTLVRAGLRRILEYRPDTRVLMLSVHDNEEFLFEALRVGHRSELVQP